jgi:radical SAM protein with 4Fe4S-binding SPASM domain
MTSKTFCILPWIHIYANPDGSVLPCCVADHHRPLGNLRNQSVKTIWNNDSYKTLRKKMLAGDRCTECTGCYQAEDKGIQSVRQSRNNEYKKFFNIVNNTKEDGFLEELSLRHFDIRWSNICNLKYKNKSVIDLWKNFSNININASIDSWGEKAEYIREGTVWKDIEHNIKTVQQEVPHVKLQTGSVISVFNLYTIPEFLNYLLENNLFSNDSFHPYFYNIMNPAYYSADVIPDNLKKIIINRLTNLNYNQSINNEIKKVIIYLQNSEYNSALREQFINTTTHYDKIRNRSFVNTFPELRELFI